MKKGNGEKYSIAIAGTGYVGLSLAALLAQHYHVTAVDIVSEKIIESVMDSLSDS